MTTTKTTVDDCDRADRLDLCIPSSARSSPDDPPHPTRLDVREAVALAREIRDDLRPRTKDRKWRLKSYRDCFKASHAISWALENVDPEEAVAVDRLNRLIDYGLLTHVVDPAKKIRVGETRTLYFRIASDEVLDGAMARDADSSPCSGRVSPLVAGKFGGDIRCAGDAADVVAIQKQLIDLDRILQQTVKQLNHTRGKLNVMHQEMLGLITHQISAFVMIFLMYINAIFVLSLSGVVGWFTAVAFVFTMIVSTRCGWRCITLWNYLDSRDMLIETIVVDNEDGPEQEIFTDDNSYNVDPTRPRSIRAAISMSLKMATAAGLNSFKRLPSRHDKSIVLMRDERSLPNVENWKHRPILICANTTAVPDLITADDGTLPLGVPFKFSSALFEGTCLIRVKGSRSDAPEDDAKYFSGRKRIFQSIIQGRFKEEVKVSDVMTGHEFARPLKNLPHPIILKTATNILSRISPGTSIAVHTDQPHIKATLMETTQIFRGDQPGNEPDIACHRIQEDSSVFGGAFAKENITSSRRKRIFSNPAKCHDYTFDTETVYTFEFYQNAFDSQTYSLDLGFAKISCVTIFDGQPIQWLGKMRDGRYLWSFQIWHENLLSKDSGK
ncbi:hypothetical protein ACHAW5_009380 [Stephanodiscus triporus]|uniref:DEP domain-containing protein n=1 Tax=Stephanodiscus triporus TaxID=2934178 RepID=A0ABD3NUV0_9STRA